jgi:DNA-binding response OmpR family regulator
VPVLVITGDTDGRELERLQAQGIPVLHKPFRADALLGMILQLLARQDPHAAAGLRDRR